METLRDLTPEEEAAIAAYAAKHGRTWKSKLSQAWMSGGIEEGTGGILRSLRNSHGPSWLFRFRLPSRYRIEFEDHGQDLLWIECDAKTGTITDCGPYFQSLYVGAVIKVKTLRTVRNVEVTRHGDTITYRWLMARLSLDGKVLCDARVPA